MPDSISKFGIEASELCGLSANDRSPHLLPTSVLAIANVRSGSSELVALNVQFWEGESASEGLERVRNAGSAVCRLSRRYIAAGTTGSGHGLPYGCSEGRVERGRILPFATPRDRSATPLVETCGPVR